MKIITKDNIVFATHSDTQAVDGLYPGTIAFTIPDTFRKSGGKNLAVGDVLPECLDLATAKTMMHCHIESGMSSERDEGFSCSNGIKIQCAEIDMIRWMQAKAMVDIAGLSAINIRDYENVIHEVPAEQFNVMLLEVGGYIQDILSRSWQLKDIIDGSDSIADILLAQWSV